MIAALLADVGGRYPGNLSNDDGTVMVMRANGGAGYYSFAEKLGAAARFAGTLVRSVNPNAERAPFPDANLANIGGAIIPALGRRWRARGNGIQRP
jgi:hypothetical protein